MNMNDLAKMAEGLRQQPKKEKPRYRVRSGKIVLRMRAVLAEPKPASNVARLLPKETANHIIGAKCPHCLGQKVYRWHLTDREEKCYRCHGKGVLDYRDLSFLDKRAKEKRPICEVVTA